MTQPTTPPEPVGATYGQPSGGKRTRRRVGTVLGAIAAVVVAAGVVTYSTIADDPDTSTPAVDSSQEPAADEQSGSEVEVADEPDPEPSYHDPAVDDFTLEPKILSQECFGSAGCLVEFRVELTYIKDFGQGLDPDITYEITYELHGAEDPYINTLELTGTQYSTEESESVSTVSSDAELTIEVVSVSEQ